MSEFIACLSYASCPGRVELIACRHDPRLERGDGYDMLRARGWPSLEWSLPVIDRAASLKALNAALTHARCRDGSFACRPMDVRAEAVRLTTRRTPAPTPGLLGRLGLRGRAA